jgi:hypothetical protein
VSLCVVEGAELAQRLAGYARDLRGAVAVGTLEGAERPDMVAGLLEEQTEVACGVRIAALLGSTVGSLGAREIAVSLEQHTEAVGTH